MAIIKSISGIRGTLGGASNESLHAANAVRFAMAYGTILKKQYESPLSVVVGRDGRASGDFFENIVAYALASMGINVIKAGYTTTPTIEMAVILLEAQGGIMLTASHNPKNWNALKFFNEKGEFVDAVTGGEILRIGDNEDFLLAKEEEFGKITVREDLIDLHIESILKLDLVQKDLIRKAEFTIVADAINSTGAFALPKLFEALGIKKYTIVNDRCNGHFAHNPEPLQENLISLASEINAQKAHVGFAVDPDVDRLAIVCEDGEMFGEEYTLVSVADYVLSKKEGNTVSNLSSTIALRDVTLKHGFEYHAAAVGEVNVVEKMKEVNAVIGGEGNGGVIFPELHYGRDALVGIALFLSHLAKSKKPVSILRSEYPNYFMSKTKVELPADLDTEALFLYISERSSEYEKITIDGLKLLRENEWVHLRKSNTEPIIRIYAESDSTNKSEAMTRKIIEDIKEFINPKTESR